MNSRLHDIKIEVCGFYVYALRSCNLGHALAAKLQERSFHFSKIALRSFLCYSAKCSVDKILGKIQIENVVLSSDQQHCPIKYSLDPGLL